MKYDRERTGKCFCGCGEERAKRSRYAHGSNCSVPFYRRCAERGLILYTAIHNCKICDAPFLFYKQMIRVFCSPECKSIAEGRRVEKLKDLSYGFMIKITKKDLKEYSLEEEMRQRALKVQEKYYPEMNI